MFKYVAAYILKWLSDQQVGTTWTEMDDRTGHLCPFKKIRSEDNPVNLPKPGRGDVDEDPGI